MVQTKNQVNQDTQTIEPQYSSTQVQMAVDVAGLHMKNPVTDAAGTFAAGREYSQFVSLEKLGAVTTKSVASEPWEGNVPPRIAEIDSGCINCIGVQNPGMKALRAGDLAWLETQNVPIILSVAGHSVDEYKAVVEYMNDDDKINAFEINISCPNISTGGMSLGTDPNEAGKCIRAVRDLTNKTLIVKLTPNVTDITVIAKACVDAGADALSLINSPKGMVIDAYTRRPKLSRVEGGMSGPAVKPIALRDVWETHKAVDVPLIGIGGIRSGIDAVEFMLAGATAVAVGSANFVNPHATLDVIEGIKQYCIDQGVSDVNDLIGGLIC